MPAPIEVHCPECQATLKLKNRDAAGRKVPCPKCKQPFVITIPDEDEVLDDFDDFDEFDEGDDFGDLDEAPASSAKSQAAAPKKSGKKLWIIVGAVVGLAVVGVGGFFGARQMGWIGGGDQVAQGGDSRMPGMPGGGMPGGGMQGMPGGGMPGMPGGAKKGGPGDKKGRRGGKKGGRGSRKGGRGGKKGAPGAAKEAPDAEKAAGQSQSTTQAVTPPDAGPNQEFDTHWLPADSQVVAAFNIGKLWASAETQQALSNPTLGPELKQMLEEIKKETILGPDDVDKITVGVSGVTDVMKVALSASKGQIDEKAIEKAAKEKLIPAMVVHLRQPLSQAHVAAIGQKMEKLTLDGTTVFALPQEGDAPRVLVHQADSKTLVFSVESFIKQLIANGDPYTPRPDLAFVDGGQDFVVAMTLPEPLAIPLPPNFAASPDAQHPAIKSLLGLNGKLKGLGLGFKTLENGSMSLKLQGLSSDEAGAASGKVSMTEALKLGRELLVPLKQNTYLAELLQPVEAGLNGSKIIQAGPEFGFLAAFKIAGGETGGLVSLLAPAVQQAREAARAASCRNNLKQIALAFFNYRDGNPGGTFPAASITSKDGKPLLSWRVAILPYIEGKALYDQFKLDEPWDSLHNKALIGKIPPSYVCPSGELEAGMTTYRLVVSGKSAYKDGKPLDKAALASLGPAVVQLIVDAGDEHAVAWTDPRPFDSPGELSGHHGERGANVAFADGSVQAIAGGDAVAVPVDPNDDGSKDQAKFQGAWTVTAASVNGKAVASMVNQGFTFQNNRLLQQVRAGQQPLQSTFLINITVNPRTFDWLQSGNKKLLGLYQFRGNSLKLTVALPGQPRPKALNAKGASVLQLSLKRGDATGTARRPNSSGSAAATKGAKKKNAGPPAKSPGANLQGSAKELFETVNNRELVATTSQGQRISIQLNPDGTTRDGEGNESPTYTINGLALSWEANDRIITVNFQSGRPKVGDNCTVQHKKKSDGSVITGSFKQLKIAEINPAKPKRKPASAIDGNWKIVSAVVSGKPADSLKGRMLSFAEGKAALNVAKLDAIEYRFTYGANTKAKPAEFKVYNGERLLMTGIYRYQGNRLFLCFVRGEKTEPPEDFTAKGIGHQLYVLEPVKTP